MLKHSTLAAADMRPLPRGRGSCLAFNHIKVPGKGRLPNREPPDHAIQGLALFLR
jgi:hypothetical protein